VGSIPITRFFSCQKVKAAGLRIQDQSQAGGFNMPGVRPGPHVI